MQSCLSMPTVGLGSALSGDRSSRRPPRSGGAHTIWLVLRSASSSYVTSLTTLTFSSRRREEVMIEVAEICPLGPDA
jgi:hypothetical protein